MKNAVTRFALGGLAALALSTGAQATVFYGTGGSGLTSLSGTSAAIDFGSVVTSFTVDATLGLTVSSLPAATLTAAVSEGLQTVQGCTKAAASCAPGDWVGILGKGLSLGGASFTQTVTPTDTKSFDTGSLLVSGVAVQSLRLSFDAATISPAASIGATGSLTAATVPVPEPGVWAMMLAGVLGIGAIARRRVW